MYCNPCRARVVGDSAQPLFSVPRRVHKMSRLYKCTGRVLLYIFGIYVNIYIQ